MPASVVSEKQRVSSPRKLALRIAFYFARRFGRCSGRVVFLSRHTCVKCGSDQLLVEAEAMTYVSAHTSLPVPRVRYIYASKGQTYLVMERLKGRSLAYSWHALDQPSKRSVLEQLHTYMSELRGLRPKSAGCVSSVGGGPFADTRLPSSDQHGPFPSVKKFHEYLRNGMNGDEVDARPEVKELTTLQETTSDAVCLTHSDLNLLNVLIHDGRVSGIIDWEFAGWMPLYWEYTNACLGNPMTRFQKDDVDKLLDPIPTTLRMETLRRDCFGDF